MEQKIYRVYGEDTFAHETFMVAEFNSREAAEKELQRCRDSVMHQCEELRDEFWIVDCTPKQVEEANRREAEEREARRKAMEYDKDMLKQDIETLLADIRRQLQGKHLSYNCSLVDHIHDAEAKIANPSVKVNYDGIMLFADSYDSGNSNVNMEVVLGGYKASSAVRFFHSEEEMLEWLDSDKCSSDSVAQADELVKMLFDD